MTIFKFNENSRKFSKRVENTVGKGEIARYEQFLLFPQCFQKACFPGASKGDIVWEWVKACHLGRIKFGSSIGPLDMMNSEDYQTISDEKILNKV